MKKVKSLVLLLILFLPFVTACSKAASPKKANDKLKITTTFFPVYEFTKEVVGKYGDVQMIMPPNVEPHDFEPSAKNMAQISDSDLFVYNSNNLEAWANSAKKSSSKKTVFVEATKGIDLLKDGDKTDPHTWLDPVLAKKEVENISQQIIKKDPKHKSYYEKRTQNYLKELDNLNQQYQNMSDHAKEHTFIVQHEAFSYLANQYHLTQKALTGVNDTEEPSAKQLADIQKYMQEHNLHYIFVEDGLSPKIANTIKDATHAQLLTLNTMEQVSKKEISDGATYISIMESNLKALEKALH